jgi:hypothetical protein
MNRASSSTSPSTRACAARFGPPTNRSLLAAPFRSCTALGSKRRSSRALAVAGAARVDDLVRRLPCARVVGREV